MKINNWHINSVAILLCLSVVLFVSYKWRGINFKLNQTELDILADSDYQGYKIIRWLNTNAKDSEVILTFDQTVFAYYSNKKFIAHDNPNTAELYLSENSEQLYKKLIALNVKYIYVPAFYQITFYHSIFVELSKHTHLIKPIMDVHNVKLYKLQV